MTPGAESVVPIDGVLCLPNTLGLCSRVRVSANAAFRKAAGNDGS